jgi:hypothetical protein
MERFGVKCKPGSVVKCLEEGLMIIGLEYAVCREREEHSEKLANHYKELLNAILIAKTRGKSKLVELVLKLRSLQVQP